MREIGYPAFEGESHLMTITFIRTTKLLLTTLLLGGALLFALPATGFAADSSAGTDGDPGATTATTAGITSATVTMQQVSPTKKEFTAGTRRTMYCAYFLVNANVYLNTAVPWVAATRTGAQDVTFTMMKMTRHLGRRHFSGYVKRFYCSISTNPHATVQTETITFKAPGAHSVNRYATARLR